MGWFDDQLNFDASVSPSVFYLQIFQGHSFIEKVRSSYLSTLQMYSTDIGSLDARVASDLDPAGRESIQIEPFIYLDVCIPARGEHDWMLGRADGQSERDGVGRVLGRGL